MFDFPNTPSTGQTVTSPTGAAYSYDGTKWIPAATAAATVPMVNDVGRNLIHNPTFTVAQRGAGPFTTNNIYTLDRWVMVFTNDTMSVTQFALADADRAAIGDEGIGNALQNVFTGSATAGSFDVLLQKVEGVRRLGGKTVTLSLWAKAASGTPSLAAGIGQNFGTGGSPSASVGATYVAQTISATWARYSWTIAVPSASGKTLGTNGDNFSQVSLAFSLQGTFVQSNTIQIAGIQLEIGSVATPLDYGGSPADQLRQCQRYYWTGFLQFYGYTSAGAWIGSPVTFPVYMRAAPTIAFSGPSYGNASGITAAAVNAGIFTPYAVVTATGNASFGATFTASADL